jgi:hypothetical protein
MAKEVWTVGMVISELNDRREDPVTNMAIRYLERYDALLTWLAATDLGLTLTVTERGDLR